MSDLLENTPEGLWCDIGQFHVDPYEGGVDTAVISHAHSDHARPNSNRYICTEQTEPLLRRRVGDNANITALAYGEEIDFHGVTVSLHPGRSYSRFSADPCRASRGGLGIHR